MSKKLDINENHLLVLSLFTRGYNREYYIREITTLLPLSHGTAQKVLTSFEKKAVLESSLKGKIRVFRIRHTPLAREYLTLSELYKKIRFMEEKPYVSEVMARISPYFSGLAVIFGSYAKGTETSDSDLDLFLAGTCDRKEVARIAAQYSVDVNLQVYPREVFERDLSSDPLLREVLDSHISWMDTEYFVHTVVPV
jgi:predicted nucleotidyltransferase